MEIAKAYEPNKENRFIVYFESDELPLPSFSLSKLSNIRYNVMVKRWEPIYFSIPSIICPSSEQLIQHFIEQRFSSIEKIKIHQLGPVGDVVSEYILEFNAVEYIDLGKFDWESNDIRKIEIAIRPQILTIKY